MGWSCLLPTRRTTAVRACTNAAPQTENAGYLALANKTARITWALLAKGGVYKAPAPAV